MKWNETRMKDIFDEKKSEKNGTRMKDIFEETKDPPKNIRILIKIEGTAQKKKPYDHVNWEEHCIRY